MNPTENLDTLNTRLETLFGKYLDGRPMYRIVFSEDQFEKREGEFEDRTPEGFLIRVVKEIREVPKYRQWVNPPCFILERLIEVPEMFTTELTTKTSYEPLWTFRDTLNQPLRPTWPAIRLVINTVLTAAAHQMGVKYRDPREEEADPKIAVEVREKRLKDIEEDLFGNESKITDGLAYHGGIVVPANYNKGVH